MSELTIGFSASASKQEQLNELMGQIMGCYSVSDDEGPLTDAVEVFLKKQPHLTVRRHGDTLVASTDFGRERRVILAGHLDTVPVIDNFPPKWLQPGDPLIREDVAAGHEHERVIWGRGATDMKGSDAVMLYLAATLTDAKYDLTYVFYDHEEVAAEKNGLRKVVESHPDWITGDFAIIGEPTDCGIEGGCNGTMRFDVITHGVAAHSARAWMGKNAIHAAAEILNRLNAHENRAIEVDGLTYQEGLNATLISGGKGLPLSSSFWGARTTRASSFLGFISPQPAHMRRGVFFGRIASLLQSLRQASPCLILPRRKNRFPA